MKKSNWCFYFVFILYIYSSQVDCQNLNVDGVNAQTIFHLSRESLTYYEFEKNLSTFLSENLKNTNEFPNKEKLVSWSNDFINNRFLLAKLYFLNYNNDKEVLSTLQSMERTILTQPYGLVYNELVNQSINDSQEKIVGLLSVRKKKYELEYIKLSAESALHPAGTVNNEEKFYSLVDSLKEKKNFIHNTYTGIWPFDKSLYDLKDIITAHEKGDLFSWMSLNNDNYIVFIKNVIYNENYNYEKDSIYVVNYLKATVGKYLYDDLMKGLYKQIKLNKKTINLLMTNYDIHDYEYNGEFSHNSKISNKYESYYNDTLFAYKLKDIMHQITVRDFLLHYYNAIMIPLLEDETALTKYIYKFVLEEKLLSIADSLKIREGIKFILDRKNYLNKTMLNYFEKRKLYSETNVTDKEVRDEYISNNVLYTEPEKVTFTVISSKDKSLLQRIRILLTQKKLSRDELKTISAESERSVKVDTLTLDRNSAIFSKVIINNLFGMRYYPVSEIYTVDKINYLFQRLNELGKVVRPLGEVYKEIVQKLKMDKVKKKISELIEKSKTCYTPIINGIDEYVKGLSEKKMQGILTRYVELMNK